MTVLDDKLLPAVKSLAAKLGKDVTVVIETLTYAPTTGLSSRSTTSHTNQKLMGIRPVSREYLERGLAEDGDTQAMFAASGLSFTPALGMRVTFGGKTYTTLAIYDIYSGESITAYRVVLRVA